MITQRDGWWMPTSDRVGFRYISAQASDISTIVDYCQDRRVCIQAGGNIGIWPASWLRYLSMSLRLNLMKQTSKH
jgi:hypothetical protein